ncbi:hypothetical protein BFJ66_g17670 [Fusarium oxysporum f. sp. cepae]|nr:hypothetical protein BFJ67_g17542 [Fusarium oxysporum f. sp. cepae]RKK21224.1 hypothetical protein BFJ66_g17670 [Fusarium oxysporum f. sp. cepae]
MFIVCRLDFAVVSRVVFKVFPCCLWGVGLVSPIAPPPPKPADKCWLVMTLLSSANAPGAKGIPRFPAGTTRR